MIQCYISVSGKSMWISWISSSFKGEIRVHLCRGVFQLVQWLSNLFKEQGSIKSDHVCGSESCHEQRRLLRTSDKVLLSLIRQGKVTKPSLKSLDSTNPQSDRLCKNGGNSSPLLPSWKVVDQQRSLQSRTCYGLRGSKSSQGNF